MLRVRDTGMGIPPEILPRIFELFVQDRQAIDRSQGGLGIGLSIVRNLVAHHGGSVSAHSDGLGCGTEFVVRLPWVARPDAVAPAVGTPVSAAKSPNAGAPRVLVIDDNKDGSTMLAKALTHLGHDTRMTHDAPTALRVAAEFLPDVAVVDIGLPVMNGYELATHLRRIPGLAGLRLIALTGYSQESDRQKSRAAGFDHHLVKPVDIDVLEKVMAAGG